MKIFAKKLCSIILALCVIFSAIFVLPVSAATTVSTMQLNTPILVTVDAEEHGELYFTPQEDGVYVFSSTGDLDTVATLYDSDGNNLTYDDDSGDNNNFQLYYSLIAGKKYVLHPRTYNHLGGTFAVSVTLFDIVSINIDDITVYEHWNTSIHSTYDPDTDSYNDWYYYQYSPSFSVELRDGSVINSENGRICIDEQYLQLTYDDGQSYNNQWTVGSHTITGEILGVKDTFTVTVEENPAESIHINDVTLYEGLDSSTEYSYNEETGEYDLEWQYYFVESLFTVTLKNGTVLESNSDGDIYYNGKHYYGYRFNTQQSYENQWSVGTQTVKLKILGMDCSFNATILPSPVKSITIEPINIVEGTNGYWSTRWDSELQQNVEFYQYEWGQNYATIEFNDGSTVTTRIWDSFEYNGEYYSLNYSDSQYETHWTVGNTYTVNVDFGGVSVNVPVTVVPSPVKSITIEPINIVEGTNGYWTTRWDSELQQNIEYYRYEWQRNYATVEFDDGNTVTTRIWNSFEYNGEYYSLNFSDNQYETHWTAGNTYTVNVDFGGVSVNVPVTIVPSPVKSISVEPITIQEGTHGWLYESYDEFGNRYEYFRYQWYDIAKVNVEFTDGTTQTYGLFDTVTYKDYSFNINWDNTQSYDNQWTIGNTYTEQITVCGQTVEASITITESPIKSISAEPVTVKESANSWRMSSHYGEYTTYTWWNYDFPITVEFADGTTTTTTLSNGVEHNGEFYEFTYSDSQDYTNIWQVDNTYYETISLGGKNTTIAITTEKRSPYTSIEIVSVKSIREEQYNYIDEYGNKIYNCPSIEYKVSFADGSSYTRSTGYVDSPATGGGYVDTSKLTEAERYAACLSYSLIHNQREQPWTMGGENLLQVTIGAFSFEVSVPLTTATDWEYVEQNGELYITNCYLTDYEITVPSELDGKQVVGIMSLGWQTLNNTRIINIPASVKFISNSAFQGNHSINTINLGSGITSIDADTFRYCYGLQQINVTPSNPNYCSVDGIVYNKTGDTLVVYPIGRYDTYYIPDNVVNIDVLFEKDYYSSVNYEFSENSQALVEEDGVIYNKDKTIVIKCDSNKTGSYEMPDSVTTISAFAFSGSNLSSITVSDNVSELVYNTFSYCQNLETITLPDTLTSIGESVFYESNLKNLTTLPNSVEYIGDSAFENTDIQSISIPSSVKEIGHSAFENSPLANLTLSEGLWGIYASAFANTDIKSLIIPDSVEYIADYAFADTPLERVTIGTGIKFISHGVFNGCKSLKDVNIPENIGSILDFAFANSGMTSVKIPDSVTDITYYSFAYSTDLKSIDIPDNLNRIDGHAFEGTAWYEAQPEGVVYLENALYYYKGEITKDTDIVVKDGTTIIADYAFELGYDWWELEVTRDMSGLKSVTLPDSVKAIGDYAFYRCSNLEKIVIPASVQRIGYNTFFDCNNLTIYGVSGSYAQDYALRYGIPFVATVEKQTSGVTVSAPDNILNSDAQLIVDSVATDDIADKFEGATNIKAFDIYFELAGNVIAPNGDVNVEISVPDEFDGRYCTIYHVADDNTVTDMQAVHKDGKLLFTTNHFSIYVIVENKPNYMAGDVNSDGDINNRDLGILMQHLNGWPVQVDTEASDVNRDGDVNNRDYGILMQYINGWPVEIK